MWHPASFDLSNHSVKLIELCLDEAYFFCYVLNKIHTMPSLGAIRYPNVTFLNLQDKKHVSVDISRNTAQLKSSKRARGPGYMYRIEVVKSGQKFSRILGETDYNMLKKKMGTSYRGSSSSKKSRSKSRSGKKMRSMRKKSTRKKSTRKKSTRKKSTRKKSACNKKKSRACKKSKKCAYVPSKRTGRKSSRHKSYCRSKS